MARIFHVPLSRVDDNPFQPRTHYDEAELDALAESIKTDGIIQFPRARLVDASGAISAEVAKMANLAKDEQAFRDVLADYPDWRIQLMYGHRRRRAFERSMNGRLDANDHIFPIVLDQSATDADMAVRVYVENDPRFRQNLSSADEARYMQRLMEEFEWSQQQVAEQLGLQRPSVSNKLRLLKLPDEVLAYVQSGTISERQASALIPAFDLAGEEISVMTDVGTLGRDGYAIREETVQLALDGRSSDELRARVQSLKEAIQRKVLVSRNVPPTLYVDTLEGLIDYSHAGILQSYGSEYEVESYLEIAGGHLPDGMVVRFLITGAHTNEHGTQITGGELLTVEEFDNREHHVSHDRYGTRLQTTHGEWLIAGHGLVLRTVDDADLRAKSLSTFSVTSFEQIDPVPDQVGMVEKKEEGVSPVDAISEKQAEELVDEPTADPQVLGLANLKALLESLEDRHRNADPKVSPGLHVFSAPTEELGNAAERYRLIVVDADTGQVQARSLGEHQMAQEFAEIARRAQSSYEMFKARYERMRVKEASAPPEQPVVEIPPTAPSGNGIESRFAFDAAPPETPFDQWPEPVMPEVYTEIGKMTKGKLEEVQERFTCRLWSVNSRDWAKGYRKGEMLQYVTELLRFHANLAAVYLLSPAQLDQMLEWMRTGVGDHQRSYWISESDGLHEASYVYEELVDIEKQGHLEGAALLQYQRDCARRIGAFYYHAYYTAHHGVGSA